MKPRGGGPRRPSQPQAQSQAQRESLLPPQPPTPSFPHARDSDASFASFTTTNRPSSSFGTTSTRAPPLPSLSDHSYKQTALRSINTYLTSHNFHVTLSLKPLPSANHITETLKFLLHRVHFTCNSNKLEDDLFLVLKYLNCPHKINKSAFRAPGAPHSFPLLLAVIHWLVQLADFADHLSADEDFTSFKKDSIMSYAVDSYMAYMKGDDDEVKLLDQQLTEKMEKETQLWTENLTAMDEEAKALEMELNELKSVPSERETYERQSKGLEVDLDKFQGFVARLQDANSVTMKALEEKEKELGAKVEEIRRTREENEELKKRVEAQGINMRDAERMKRELMAVEREISEAEAARSSWEEKCWDLDAAIGQKFKELEALSIECNQALRRIKLGGDFQYVLNGRGSSAAEVLGIDYKSTLKPAISSFTDEIKKSTTVKLEEYIALQQLSKDMTVKIETKKNRLAALQLQIDDRSRHLETMKNEIEKYTSWCVSEAQRIVGEVEEEARNFDLMEREALDTLKAAEIKLQDETRQSEQETQLCAYELFALIDSVSRFKEHVENKMSVLKNDLIETTEAMSGTYKKVLTGQFNMSLEMGSLASNA